jgi:hypothetical protein
VDISVRAFYNVYMGGEPREKSYLSQRKRLWLFIIGFGLLAGSTAGFALDFHREELDGFYMGGWLFGMYAMVLAIAGYYDKYE